MIFSDLLHDLLARITITTTAKETPTKQLRQTYPIDIMTLIPPWQGS